MPKMCPSVSSAPPVREMLLRAAQQSDGGGPAIIMAVTQSHAVGQSHPETSRVTRLAHASSSWVSRLQLDVGSGARMGRPDRTRA